jgi:ATP-dependent DNA ligase
VYSDPREVTPTGEKWVHEIKLDGFRVLVRRDGGISVFTKQGNDYTGRFPRIVSAVGSLKVRSITLDGAAMCFTNGREDFEKLWDGSRDAVLCAFDMLELNGIDLRKEPYSRGRRSSETYCMGKSSSWTIWLAMDLRYSSTPVRWDWRVSSPSAWIHLMKKASPRSG